MLYLKSWLEDYVDLQGISDSELCEIISLKSGEVDEYKVVSDYFDGKVVVGRIEEIKAHPNADKLKILQINIGQKTVQILTAATNIYEQMVVAVALDGAKLPQITIQTRPMRGETSEGMCLGKSELLLEKTSPGLWDLSIEYTNYNKTPNLGASLCAEFPEFFPAEAIFDIKFLQDKFSSLGCHLGLAVEIARLLGDFTRLKGVASQIQNPENFWLQLKQVLENVEIQKEDQSSFADQTGYTNLFFLFNLTNSTKDLQLPLKVSQRLFLLNYNLLDNFADLSNYLLYDLGQPSHFATQFNESCNWKIESLTAEQTFQGLGQLKQKILPVGTKMMLDSENNLLWLPGISGSDQTKVDGKTEFVSIEVANFDHEAVARNCFLLNYRSEGARFWAGKVNLLVSFLWLYQFTNLLPDAKLDLKIAWANTDKLNPSQEPTDENFADDNFLSQIEKIYNRQLQKALKIDKTELLGRYNQENLDPHLVEKFEQKLSLIGSVEADNFVCEPFYGKVESTEDLFFEVSRLVGYEFLQKDRLTASANVYDKSHFDREYFLKNMCLSTGYSEVINRPFVNSTNDKVKTTLKLLNSFSQEFEYLREDLFVSLAQNISKNLNLGISNPKLFELAKVYILDQIDNQLKEKRILHILEIGPDPYSLTTTIHKLAKQTNARIDQIQPLENDLSKGYIYNAPSFEAELVEIKNSVKKDYKISPNKRLWSLKITFTDFENLKFSNHKSYHDESSFPVLKRAVSLNLDNGISWQKIEQILNSLTVLNTKIDIMPTERFLDQARSVVNFELNFTNYTRTIDSQEVELYLTQFLTLLKEFDPQAIFR